MALKDKNQQDKESLRELVLPDNTDAIVEYVRKNEELVYKKTTALLSDAIRNKREAVRVFSFGTTGYYVFLQDIHYQQTLENIIDMAAQKRFYKICDTANNVLNIFLARSTVVELTRRNKNKKPHDRQEKA